MFCNQSRFHLPTRVINSEQFWALVRAPRTAQLVSEARAALANGDKALYDRKKKLLPLMVFIGTFEESEKDVENKKTGEKRTVKGCWRVQSHVCLNGLVVADYDHVIEADQTEGSSPKLGEVRRGLNAGNAGVQTTPTPPNLGGESYLVIDRLSADNTPDNIARLVDSAETAFYEGNGSCRLLFPPSNIFYDFSMKYEADGMTFEEPNDNMFSFNSPVGACPECQGFGRVIGIDEKLVIPNTTLSVYDGCVVCWHGEKMKEWKDWFCRHAAEDDFPIFEPYMNLTQQQKDWLWHGLPSDKRKKERPCIDAFFDMLKENQYKIQYRVMLSRYRGKTNCPVCHGTRLKPEANYVKIGGRSITDLVQMPVVRLKEWFDQLLLDSQDQEIGRRLLVEITSRLQFLLDVGLGYLTLNRLSNSLSGGESQRINLCTSLGSSLVGSL